MGYCDRDERSGKSAGIAFTMLVLYFKLRKKDEKKGKEGMAARERKRTEKNW